jgi:DNA-binding LacI/PurR family transcriptional regulator
MAKNITLKDVARRSGVSYQTVSKVIRNERQVSPEVWERIQRAIEELGYRPNAAAQNLRTKSSRLIGYSWHLLRPEDNSQVLNQFQHSIVEYAEEFGYHILLFPYKEDRSFDTTYEAMIHTRQVDGFILSSVEYSDPRLSIIYGQELPVVSFGRAEDDMPISYVDVDGRAGIAAAVHHLQQEGHERIAIIAWPEESRVGSERFFGYIEAMSEAQLSIDPDWIVRGTGEIQYGYTAACNLLDLPTRRRPTAIVTLLDTIAIGAMQAIDARGLQVGSDIAVTGFDDMPVAHHLKPSLTTVRQPIWEVGRAVVHSLIAQIEGQPYIAQSLLTPELIVRESSVGFPLHRGG